MHKIRWLAEFEAINVKIQHCTYADDPVRTDTDEWKVHRGTVSCTWEGCLTSEDTATGHSSARKSLQTDAGTVRSSTPPAEGFRRPSGPRWTSRSTDDEV